MRIDRCATCGCEMTEDGHWDDQIGWQCGACGWRTPAPEPRDDRTHDDGARKAALEER